MGEQPPEKAKRRDRPSLTSPHEKGKRSECAAFFLRAATVCACVALLEAFLSTTTFDKMLVGAAYAVSQRALQDAGPAESAIALIDLSPIVARRVDTPPVRGVDDYELAVRWDALRSSLQAIADAKPRAILVDWELGLSGEYLDPVSSHYRFRGRAEVGEAYRRLFSTLAALNKRFPVYVAADQIFERVTENKEAFPEPEDIGLAVTTEVLQHTAGDYAAIAVERTGARPPSIASAEVAKRAGLPERLNSRPDRLFIFQARSRHEEEGFWIDYSPVSALLNKTISASIVQLASPTTQGTLHDKIVLMTDVANPAPSDQFLVPLPLNARVMTNKGSVPLIYGSGGIIHACALLTRANGPLYATPHGVPEFLLVFLLAMAFTAAAEFIHHLIAHRRKGSAEAQKPGRPSRATETAAAAAVRRDHSIRAAVETGMLLLSAVAAYGMLIATPVTRILFLGAPIFMMTRIADAFLSSLAVLLTKAETGRQRRS